MKTTTNDKKGKNGSTLKHLILAVAVLAGSSSLLYAMVVTKVLPTTAGGGIKPKASSVVTEILDVSRFDFCQTTTFWNDSNQKVKPCAQHYSSDSDETSALYSGKTGINVGITMSICSSGSETLYITGCAKSAAGKDFKINKSFCVGPGTRVYHICGIESAQDFDDNFDIIKQIDWKITDKDRNVLFCGSSDNNIYHVPTSAPGSQFDTVLYVVCNAMAGKKYGGSSAVYAIWSAFSGLNVTCANGDTLHYWSLSDDGGRVTDKELLDPRHRSGQCSAWADFLVDCGQLAGADDYFKGEVTLVSTDGQMIFMKDQEWKDNGYNYGHKSYRYQEGKDWIPHDGDYSIPCQGRQTPVWQEFANHVIVYGSHKGKDWYWDPCYGNYSAGKAACLALENQEVDATFEEFKGGPGQPSELRLARQK
jgi:hypothetical protein